MLASIEESPYHNVRGLISSRTLMIAKGMMLVLISLRSVAG
jgi:hypothetical protein